MKPRYTWPAGLLARGARSGTGDPLACDPVNSGSPKRRRRPRRAAWATAFAAAAALLLGTARGDDELVARIKASPFPLNKSDAAATLTGKIWSDELSRLIEERAALVNSLPELKLPMATEAFTASLKSKDITFVVSALNTGDCWSSEAVPNERECPARLAAVAGDNLNVLTQVRSFPIAMVRGRAGFDESSNEKTSDRTEVRYDPKTEAFFYEVFHGNEPSGGLVQFFPPPH